MAQKLVLRNRPRLSRRQVFNRAVIGVTAAYLASLGLIFYFNSYSQKSEAKVLDGFKYRKSIVTDSSFVIGNSFISNFNMLIQHRDVSLKHKSYGGRVEDINGKDIKFTDNTGISKLNCDIENYNPETGEITAWVNVTKLDCNAPTKLFIYYGNPIVPEQYNSNTWDETHKAVYHFNNNEFDASAYANVCHSSGVSNDVGLFAGAKYFNGKTDYLSIDYASELSINDSITVSAWVKPAAFKKSLQAIVGKQYGDNANDNLFLGIDSKVKSSVFFTYDCGVQGDKNELKENEWYYVVGVAKDNSRKIYLNGVEINEFENCNAPWLKDINPLSIGAQENGKGKNKFSDFFNGAIDEVRILNACMAPNRIKTEYYNYSNPDQFYTLGEEENFGNESVQLLYFKGNVVKENTIMLEWATASEQNNKAFKILRQNADGVFEEIESVTAGNGTELETYKIIDPNPLAGTNQYKLVQEGLTKNLNSFGPIIVKNNFSEKVIGDLRLFTEQNNNKVKLHFNCAVNNELNLTLKGITGQEILTKEILALQGENNIVLDTGIELENGLYVAQFTGSNIKPITSKVVKF